MQIHDSRISMVLKKVAVLREQLETLCLAKQGPALRVMDLHYVVEQVYGLRIAMLDVDFPAVYLRGKVERYNDKTARVLVRSALSLTEKRLVTVKELCHLVIDEEDDWSNNGVAMLDDLIEESRAFMNGAVGAEKPATPLQSEALALLAAGELLYPAEFREADTAKIAADETTISAIALYHNVPPFVVEQALENEDRFARLRQEAQTALGIAA